MGEYRMTFSFDLEYSSVYVAGLEADAFLHLFRSVESEKNFQSTFANTITWSWLAFSYNLSSFLTPLG